MFRTRLIGVGLVSSDNDSPRVPGIKEGAESGDDDDSGRRLSKNSDIQTAFSQ